MSPRRSSVHLHRSAAVCSVLLASLALPAAAQAAEPRSGIDPNTFIVGHPASPTWKRVRANGEHPAVLVAGRSKAAQVDPNRFIVQPPAHAEWTVESPATLLAQKSR